MAEAAVENPVLVDADAERLLQMAESFDRTGQYRVPDGEKPTPDEVAGEVKPTEPEKPEKPEQPEKIEGRQRDEKGKFVPKESKEGEPTKPDVEIKPPEKTESDYAKAQKEQARKEKTWQQIQSEKEQVRQQAAQIEQEKRQIEAERAQWLQQNRPRATKDGFTAPDYYKASEDFAKNGDHENAFKALRTAQDLLAYEQQWYAQQHQQQQASILDNAFQADLQKAISEDPDVDPASGSPLSKEIGTLLEGHPYLYYVPEGALRTVEIAKMRLAMGELADLRAYKEKREAEDAQREKASKPIRPGPTTPGQGRSFDDMSLEEMERELEHASSEADTQWGR